MVKIPGEESFGGTVAGVGGVFSLLQKFFIGGIYICIQERHSKRTEIRDIEAQHTPLVSLHPPFLLARVHDRTSHVWAGGAETASLQPAKPLLTAAQRSAAQHLGG